MTRSRFCACTLCWAASMRLDGPGRDPSCCALPFAFVSLPLIVMLSNEVQHCSRKTNNDHRVTHETNTCVFSVNFQHDSHFQRDRIRFTVLTRDRALDA